jgi:hypothetical protein
MRQATFIGYWFMASAIAIGLIASGASCGGESPDTGSEATKPRSVDALSTDAKHAASPCVTPPANTLFCDDFDSVTDVSAGWTQAIASSGGKGKLGHGHYVSAPASYRATGSYLQEVNLTAATNPSATLDVDVRLHALPANAPPQTVWARLLVGSVTFTLAFDPNKHFIVTVTGVVPPLSYTTTAVATPDEWQHVTLSVDPDSTRLNVDGADALILATPSTARSSVRSLTLGILGGTINLDNVLVTDPPLVADAGADTGSVDAGSDASTVDASTPWTVVSCAMNTAGTQMWSAVDSNGNRFAGAGFSPTSAGGTPPNAASAFSVLAASDLSDLLAAAATMQTSTAGYTTNTGPVFHSTERVGTLDSAAVLGAAPILVDSLKDGQTFGSRTVVSANDPAATTIRKYSCINFQ